MEFTEEEKTAITYMWFRMSKKVDFYGADALERLRWSCPQIQVLLKDFDQSTNSADYRSFGAKLLTAIGEATNHLDNLEESLANITDLHAKNLKIGAGNFRLLAQCIMQVMAANFPEEFTTEVQAAWDKFFVAIATILQTKYR
ncbi:hemoglobin subunit alpha-3-like [Bombina bombina]|uniref:hemoglobin subunit alpha-3-like n=1 Tax=Bombina bombina TaxID=8345 RepID=UPI00235A7A0E|nr:hemoglobin subunit alpha-3-like [Bombina bombina]